MLSHRPFVYIYIYIYIHKKSKTLIITFSLLLDANCTSNYSDVLNFVFLMKKRKLFILIKCCIMSSGRFKPHEIQTLHEEKMHCCSSPPSLQAWISRRLTFVSCSVWKQHSPAIRLAFSHCVQCGKDLKCRSACMLFLFRLSKLEKEGASCAGAARKNM